MVIKLFHAVSYMSLELTKNCVSRLRELDNLLDIEVIALNNKQCLNSHIHFPYETVSLMRLCTLISAFHFFSELRASAPSLFKIKPRFCFTKTLFNEL